MDIISADLGTVIFASLLVGMLIQSLIYYFKDRKFMRRLRKYATTLDEKHARRFLFYIWDDD